MFWRNLTLPILLTLFLLIPLSQLSGQDEWTAWLFHREDNQYIQINHDGDVIASRRQIIPAGSHTTTDTAFSPDGRYSAYITMDSETYVQRLHILNMADGSLLPSVAMDTASRALVISEDYFTSPLFNANSTFLAFTRMEGGSGWAIDVYDVGQGAVIFTLNNQDAIVQPFTPLHPGVVPQIKSFFGDSITFMIDTGLPINQRSYTWLFRSNLLDETVAAPSPHSVAFPATGEIVSPLPDWRFPATMEEFSYPSQQSNTLQIYRAEEQVRFPFFTLEDLHFENITFVQGGEAIAVTSTDDKGWNYISIIGRNGEEKRRLNASWLGLLGTTDGLAYTTNAGQRSTALLEFNTRNPNSERETIWAAEGSWTLLWVSSQATDNYEDWARLADPIENPPGMPDIQATPTRLPEFPPLRYVGMEVQIYTQDDEYLNLRDKPTTNSNVLALLESGRRGIIIDGPVDAEGFRWWQIRISGRDGWVVESLPDVLTLIPQQALPEKTEEPSQND